MGFKDFVKGEFKKVREGVNNYNAGAEDRLKKKEAKIAAQTRILKAQASLERQKSSLRQARSTNQPAYMIGGTTPAFSGNIGSSYSIGEPVMKKKSSMKKKKSKSKGGKGKSITIMYN